MDNHGRLRNNYWNVWRQGAFEHRFSWLTNEQLQFRGKKWHDVMRCYRRWTEDVFIYTYYANFRLCTINNWIHICCGKKTTSRHIFLYFYRFRATNSPRSKAHFTDPLWTISTESWFKVKGAFQMQMKFICFSFFHSFFLSSPSPYSNSA